MEENPDLATAFEELNEYMATLEQVLIFFRDELRNPSEGLHTETVRQLLRQLDKRLKDGQQMRRDFGARLRGER